MPTGSLCKRGRSCIGGLSRDGGSGADDDNVVEGAPNGRQQTTANNGDVEITDDVNSGFRRAVIAP